MTSKAEQGAQLDLFTEDDLRAELVPVAGIDDHPVAVSGAQSVTPLGPEILFDVSELLVSDLGPVLETLDLSAGTVDAPASDALAAPSAYLGSSLDLLVVIEDGLNLSDSV